jgi:hypothetical protein
MLSSLRLFSRFPPQSGPAETRSTSSHPRECQIKLHSQKTAHSQPCSFFLNCHSDPSASEEPLLYRRHSTCPCIGFCEEISSNVPLPSVLLCGSSAAQKDSRPSSASLSSLLALRASHSWLRLRTFGVPPSSYLVSPSSTGRYGRAKHATQTPSPPLRLSLITISVAGDVTRVFVLRFARTPFASLAISAAVNTDWNGRRLPAPRQSKYEVSIGKERRPLRQLSSAESCGESVRWPCTKVNHNPPSSHPSHPRTPCILLPP